MNREVIKTGFCVAYDWELLKKSVPRVYDHADKICLSLDKNRVSWSGKPYDFDEQAFFAWVKSVDKHNKIDVYEDNFFVDPRSSIQNDNYQRTQMAKRLGEGGWHIQIDADEYFFDFKEFKSYLLKINPDPDGTEKPINICCNWISLIKKTERGYLYVNNNINEYENMPFATNRPEYLDARHNSHFDHVSPFFVLHETWARGEEQLLQKINSWGHDNDFLSKQSYFALWKALDEYNYSYIKNFHPLNASIWQKLGYVPEQDIDKAIRWLEEHGNLAVEKNFLTIRNSRIVQGLKKRLKRN